MMLCSLQSTAATHHYEFGKDYWFTTSGTILTKTGWNVSFELQQPYVLGGTVLDICYYDDDTVMFSPVDVALVWGDLESHLSSFTTTMGQRSLEYVWKSYNRSITKDYVMTHISNNHCIPANWEVYEALMLLEKGDVIVFSGELVTVRATLQTDDADSALMWGPSSTTYDDVGPGSCEIILISSITVNGVTFPSGDSITLYLPMIDRGPQYTLEFTFGQSAPYKSGHGPGSRMATYISMTQSSYPVAAVSAAALLFAVFAAVAYFIYKRRK